MSNLLVEPFNVMSTFFFRRSVEKAFQIDEIPPDLSLQMNKPITSNQPFITSAVDDVMYMVGQVLQRSLATSQRSVIGSVVPDLGRVLGSEFIGMVQRTMRDECYPKAAIQGSSPPEDKIVHFLVMINSLDVAMEYLKSIIEGHLGSSDSGGNGSRGSENLRSTFPFGNEAVFVANALNNMLNSFMTKANELLTDGISVAFHQVFKPRIRPILADAFRDVDYSVSSTDREDQYEDEEEEDDLVAKRFLTFWNTLTRPLKRLMTKATWDKLQANSLPYLASSLERRLWSMNGRISELGATKLERDISSIVAVACGEGKYELRDHFQKCQQIVMIAGMEDEEWEELSGGEPGDDEGVIWVLNRDERARARGLVLR
jgi:hypothetical protein